MFVFLDLVGQARVLYVIFVALVVAVSVPVSLLAVLSLIVIAVVPQVQSATMARVVVGESLRKKGGGGEASPIGAGGRQTRIWAGVGGPVELMRVWE